MDDTERFLINGYVRMVRNDLERMAVNARMIKGMSKLSSRWGDLPPRLRDSLTMSSEQWFLLGCFCGTNRILNELELDAQPIKNENNDLVRGLTNVFLHDVEKKVNNGDC